MQHITLDIPLQDFDRPQCPTCGTAMWLVRIEPARPGFDERTFECPVCERVETRDVKYADRTAAESSE